VPDPPGGRAHATRREHYLLPFILVFGLALALAFAAGRGPAVSPQVASPAAGTSSSRPPAVSGQDVREQPAAGSISAALTAYVGREYGSENYVGPCENSVSPRDLWKRCTKLWVDQGDRLAFLEGPTFSEFTRWIFVQRLPDGAWQVYGEAPFDFFGNAGNVPWP
jgi:hypothetical protein